MFLKYYQAHCNKLIFQFFMQNKRGPGMEKTYYLFYYAATKEKELKYTSKDSC